MTHRLAPLEVAAGLVFGDDSGAEPAPPPGGDVIGALERSIAPALRRPPCLVSFSGGRDSSLMLAAAVRVARRAGLPLPIPATNRFPAAGDTQESSWQEMVIAHLGLDDWLRLDFHDELDAVGPVARRVLRRHGLLWPFNVHFHTPLLEAAAGGSLLTGIGGDELLADTRWTRASSALRGRVRPEARDLRRVALFLAPAPVRTGVIRRRLPRLPWLRPEAQRALDQALAADEAREPRRAGERLRRLQARRSLRVGLESLELIAADHDVEIAHPLATPDLTAAVARRAGWGGFDSRTAAMRQLFGDLLPAELLRRRSKASFDGAFWSTHSRELAERVADHAGDPDVVDRVALREEWSSARPDGHSYLLLQAAWLSGERESPPPVAPATASASASA